MGMPNYGYDTTTVEGATEMAKLIICGNIEDLVNISYDNDSDVPEFAYKVKIEKIYFDKDNLYKVGDYIEFGSMCGYVKANDLKKAVEDRPRAKKYNYLHENYGDNDYIRFVGFGNLAFDVNKRYIMFLSVTRSSVDNKTMLFAPSTHIQNYEIKNTKARNDYRDLKFEFNLEYIENEINQAVKNRSGEIDIILEEYYKNN
jgi:hypothetical protein